MLKVRFIHCETGDDLIVSFALVADNSFGVESLTLMRSPKYEKFLYPYERGVELSYEADVDKNDDEVELLKSIRISANMIHLETIKRTFDLDSEGIEKEQINRILQVLAKMNFDRSFKLVQ